MNNTQATQKIRTQPDMKIDKEMRTKTLKRKNKNKYVLWFWDGEYHYIINERAVHGFRVDRIEAWKNQKGRAVCVDYYYTRYSVLRIEKL